MREKYVTHGPGKFEGESPMARYLNETFGPQDYDEDASNADFGGWVGRIGRRLVVEESQGFVTYARCDTIDDAKRAFEDTAQALGCDGYTEDDEDDEDEPRRYVVTCDVCDRIGGSDDLTKADSDASWHHTMSGHNVRVLDTETVTDRRSEDR